jgi:hypothetical protein
MVSSNCKRASVYFRCPEKWPSRKALTGQHMIYAFYLAFGCNSSKAPALTKIPSAYTSSTLFSLETCCFFPFCFFALSCLLAARAAALTHGISIILTLKSSARASFSSAERASSSSLIFAGCFKSGNQVLSTVLCAAEQPRQMGISRIRSDSSR